MAKVYAKKPKIKIQQECCEISCRHRVLVTFVVTIAGRHVQLYGDCAKAGVEAMPYGGGEAGEPARANLMLLSYPSSELLSISRSISNKKATDKCFFKVVGLNNSTVRCSDMLYIYKPKMSQIDK